MFYLLYWILGALNIAGIELGKKLFATKIRKEAHHSTPF